MVHKCMYELFEIHNDVFDGQGLLLARNLLKMLMNSPMTSLKGTYLPLELLITYIGIPEVLILYISQDLNNS